MRENLQLVDWDSELHTYNDIDSVANRIETIIKENVEKYVPLQRKPSKQGKQAPWIDRKSLKAIKRKYHAWRRFQLTKGHQRYLDYVKERNKVSKKLKKAKRTFEENLAKECAKNPKAFFRYANFYKKKSTNFIRLQKKYTASNVNSGNEFTKSDTDTAEELNKFFKSIFTTENDKNVLLFNDFMRTFVDPEHPKPFSNMGSEIPAKDRLSDISITVDDVYELLKDINPNKSAGDDAMHPKVLKECAVELAYPLQKLFEMSISSGTVPKSWKSATITPIHKDEDKGKAENYRPISITSQIGKTLEKLIRKHIMAHIIDNDILTEHQHGFCEGKSCLTNLIEALEDITSLIDEGLPVDEVFLDFKKAFDKVSHERLLHKIHNMGIREALAPVRSQLRLIHYSYRRVRHIFHPMVSIR